MNPVMLDILVRSAAGEIHVDYTDPAAYNAVCALQALDYVRADADGNVIITGKGRAALATLKQSVQNTNHDRNDRAPRQPRHKAFPKPAHIRALRWLLNFLATIVGGLIIYYLAYLFGW